MAAVLYTDGGSLGNGQVNQRARMAVFDANRGAVVVDQWLGALTNNEAEYRAIAAALDYAVEQGLRPVEIRSDSLLCVNQVKGQWKVKEARLRPLAEQARRKLAALGGSITWVPREENPAGHHLEGTGSRVIQSVSEESRPTRAPASAESGPVATGDVPPRSSPGSDSVRYCVACATPLVARLRDHRERPTCPRCGWTLFEDPKVAVAAVLEVDGGILLCKRAIEPGLGKWSFPAGFVDRGEELVAALRREIAEETGLQPKLGRLVGVYSEEGNPTVLVVYAAMATGTPRTSAEAEEVKVFQPDALPELAFAHDSRIVQDWLFGGTAS